MPTYNHDQKLLDAIVEAGTKFDGHVTNGSCSALADLFEGKLREVNDLLAPIAEVQRWKATADTFMLDALTESKRLIEFRKYVEKNYVHRDNVNAMRSMHMPDLTSWRPWIRYDEGDLRYAAETTPIIALGKHLFEHAWREYKNHGFRKTENQRFLHDLSAELLKIGIAEQQ